jgi:hypothetical protein
VSSRDRRLRGEPGVVIDPVTALEASAVVEKVAIVLVPGALVALWLATRRLPPAAEPSDSPTSKLSAPEVGWLFVVLAGALLLRTFWWDRGIPATIFGGEIMTARADAAIRRGNYLAQWWTMVRGVQLSSWAYDSPVIQPLLVAFYSIVHPRLNRIVIFGGLVGTLGVGLAWLAGRVLHGPRVGLLLAGVLAVSPLQVVWSRLGYRAIAAVPHVLLVIVLATVAARRGSALLAVLTGVLSYASLYNYEAARVAVPLAFVAILAAAGDAPRPIRRILGVSVLTAVTVAVLALTVPQGSLKETLWPTYSGYAGNQGESGMVDFVQRNQERVRREGARTLDAYFHVGRTGPPTPAIWSWGIQYGGLTFLPLTLLGVAGLLAAPSLGWGALVWIWTLVLGLAVPALGCASARRLLVFDLGWSAFAAFGLALLPRSPLLRRVPLRHRPGLAAVSLGALGAWTFIAMALLGRGPGGPAILHVPFATGCLNDVLFCPRCAEIAQRWERDIANGDLVILLDSDAQRENATAPAGLSLFGQVAALGSDRPEWFQELHPVIWNLNFLPTFRQYYSPVGTPGGYLSELLRSTPYRRVVWHSERPIAWDRELAKRLLAAGGRIETFPTPFGPGVGFRVETEKANENDVIAAVTAFLPGAAEVAPTSCVTTIRVRAEATPLPANALATVSVPNSSEPPTWFALSYHQAYRPAGMSFPLPAVRDIVLVDGGGAQIRALQSDGLESTFAWPNGNAIATRVTHLEPVGRHCAAFAGGQWWVVEPESGALRAATLPPSLPRGDWLGIASDQRSELLLADADQALVAVNAESGAESFRVRIPVTPTERPEETWQCIQLVRGGGWFGVFDGARNRLRLYRDTGGSLGALDLTALGLPFVRALAARDEFLAVATADRVTTLRVDIGRCGD